MIVNLSDKELKNLRLQSNIFQTDLLSITDIDLSGNELGSESLGLLFKRQILDLIVRARNLNHLDISNNPLPPEIVLDLHDLIKKINRARVHPVTLTSDFSEWLKAQTILEHYSVHEDLPECFWLLTQWTSTENPRRHLAKLSDLLRQFPEEQLSFEDVIKNKMDFSNRTSQVLFIELIRLPTFQLASIILNSLGAQLFVQVLQRASGEVEIPKHAIPVIIEQGLLNIANSPDLAHEVIDTFLNDETPIKKEALAIIAIHERNYTQAYDLFLEAIHEGSITARVRFVELMETAPAFDRPPLNREGKQTILEYSAQRGCVRSMGHLVTFYEQQKSGLTSYQWVSAFNDAVKKNPENRLQIPYEACRVMDFRNELYQNLSGLIQNIIVRRVELVKEKCKNNLPAYNASKEDALIRGLLDLLKQPAQNYIVERIGCSLLYFYHIKSLDFAKLQQYLMDTMTSESPRTKGLMSMEPDKFAQAFHEQISEFFVTKLKFSVSPPDLSSALPPMKRK